MAKFALRASSGTGVFDRGTEQLVPPDSGSLDVLTNAVELQFDSLKPDIYRLEIQGDFVDALGNELEGIEGKKGTPYRQLLTKPGDIGVAGEVPSVSKGITMSTGPNTEFPSFLPPKSFPSGFNPADKVETRVVRLYYFRDAHRVAQIVNRDVKSFNAQGVAVKRRLADRARDEANLLTDERKSVERAAVEAAQETRRVEKQLAQEQENLQQARQRAGAAISQGGTMSGRVADLEEREGKLTSELSRQNESLETAKNTITQAETEKSVAQKALLEAQAAMNAEQEKKATVDIAAAETKKSQGEAAARNASGQITQLKADLATVRQQLLPLQQQSQMLAQSAANDSAAVVALQTRVNALQGEVQAKRAEELQKKEKSLGLEDKEARARQEQFRREVGAALEDPDTYAPGKKESVDQVLQVAISVIGESEIQLRGPIGGINIIRQMIHQIDSPTGMVKVAVHTVQINGERGDRMEKVAQRIQDHIDHSRFLTQQSSLMLRKAILTVASQKAEQARAWFPGDTQEARDYRYLYSFFGSDFINELRAIDSEFLKSGNKLLSLHSMDTTSLASALFILALAKNDIRLEILQVFRSMLETELPLAELEYFQAGTACLRQGWCQRQGEKHCLLANNAKFRSFQGFFDANVMAADTMTPLQRDFIRLAQILKSYLVTELEFKQRVMERSLIEDRLGRDYLEELRIAQTKEAAVLKELESVQQNIGAAQKNLIGALAELRAVTQKIADHFAGLWYDEKMGDKKVDPISKAREVFERMPLKRERVFKPRTYQMYDDFYSAIRSNETIIAKLDLKKPRENALQELEGNNRKIAMTIRERLKEFDRKGSELLLMFSQCRTSEKAEFDICEFQKQWAVYSEHFHEEVNVLAPGEIARIMSKFDKANEEVAQLAPLYFELGLKQKAAKDARRPLDHKKLLDLLIDDIQDKYVELLEGTRAHTANIDDYIKRLATALDDDFNTQFYHPAFRMIREASYGKWDVTLGQIETTSILTNNRSFAKVDPQATMEFDLPRRDILITEAMKGAKGLIDTYGALTQDPTFLSLTRMGAGAAPALGSGMMQERSVLPGLKSNSDESFLTQRAPTNINNGTPLDALVPEPAIYKFETGTGYEIRPVIQPDGQSVVFHLHYMYTTNIREPVRADEKHLGRVKRHFIDTNVQLGNYELREISRYQVALKAARTAKGVPLLQDIPGLGVIFRPLPSAESSLQQNLILGQTAIYPTLFDLMGLRWAPAVAELDPLGLTNADFIVRNRRRYLMNRVFDFSSAKVDEALRIPEGERRGDLYRTQESIPYVHPNGYFGPGMGLRDSRLQEGYDPTKMFPNSQYVPKENPDGRLHPPQKPLLNPGMMPPPGSSGPSLPKDVPSEMGPLPRSLTGPSPSLPKDVPSEIGPLPRSLPGASDGGSPPKAPSLPAGPALSPAPFVPPPLPGPRVTPPAVPPLPSGLPPLPSGLPPLPSGPMSKLRPMQGTTVLFGQRLANVNAAPAFSTALAPAGSESEGRAPPPTPVQWVPVRK
ncbi:MAG: hypothetical protein L0215_21965 [Gemmataceae bacterium]|nr:hypothetical protein [Gemmataceae bacterium]